MWIHNLHQRQSTIRNIPKSQSATRQVGKSTLAEQIVRTEHPGTMINLDEQPQREAAVADPEGFIARLDRPVLIDEVQRGGPDLFLLRAEAGGGPATTHYAAKASTAKRSRFAAPPTRARSSRKKTDHGEPDAGNPRLDARSPDQPQRPRLPAPLPNPPRSPLARAPSIATSGSRPRNPPA